MTQQHLSMDQEGHDSEAGQALKDVNAQQHLSIEQEGYDSEAGQATVDRSCKWR